MAEANPNLVDDLQNQFYGFFSTLSPSKKLSISFAILIVLAGLGVIIYNSQQETYSVFMNGLTPKETSVIAAELDQNQIDYRLQTGGTGLLVSSNQVDDARLKIAASGVIDGSQVGFEIFDNNNFSATEFEQNVRFRRALEGEMARLVQKIDVVESAKVLLAVPEQSVFISEERVPTAAIQLVLKNSRGLTPSVTKTISNLISSSVPNMLPENVKISDQYGNLYRTGAPEQLSAEIRNTNLKYKYEIEQYLQNKVFTQLQKVAGRDHVEVRVSADINFDESQVEENIVDPDSQTLISEETNVENSKGSRSIPIGVPGVTSNSPEIQAGSSEVANISDFNKKQTLSNYENSKKFLKQKISSGKIERLTVSILIDDKIIENVGENGQVTEELIKWTDEEKEEIANIAKVAVGFDETRGDKVEVSNLSFNIKKVQDKLLDTETQIIEKEFWTNIIKYLFFTTILLSLIFIVVRPMIRRLFHGSDELNLIMGLPSTVSEIETNPQFGGGGLGVGGMGNDLVSAAESADMITPIPPRAKILELAKDDPQKTANMVKSWLRDK